MRTPCEWTLKEYLPRVRSQVAIKLNELGKKQYEIAKIMGISQPRVFQYINYQKTPITRNIDKSNMELLITQLEDSVERIANQIIVQILQGTSAPEVIPTICQGCRELRFGSALCTFHRLDYPELNDVVDEDHNCDLCLRWKYDSFESPYSIQLLEARQDILRTLESIISRLLLQPMFSEFVPQIGTQFCLTFQYPVEDKYLKDVAGFPGRIIRFKGRAKVVSRPEFYGSGTTARLLIEFKSKAKNIISVLTIKNPINDSFEKKLQDFGFRIIKTEEGDTLGLLSQIKSIESGDKFAILDSGGQGFEPIAYLFVENPSGLINLFS